MKQLSALLAALAITGVLGLGILFLGTNALINRNTTPTLNSPASASLSEPVDASVSVQTQQTQATIAQYQAQLDEARQQLEQASTQIQQYQNLLQALQQQGLIIIGRDGTIFLPQRDEH